MLFAFCHPDDEVAIFAAMHRMVKNGALLSALWTHSTSIREAESRAALDLIELAGDQQFYLGGPDGELPEAMPTLLPKVQSVIQTVKPDRIISVAFEQGHLDHDATNYMVNCAFDGPVAEYPMYTPYTVRIPTINRFADATGEVVISLTPEEQALKERAVRHYPSQTIHRNAFWYQIWQALRLRPVRLNATERARWQPPTDFRQPVVLPPAREAVLASPQWQRWLAAIEAMETSASSGG